MELAIPARELLDHENGYRSKTKRNRSYASLKLGVAFPSCFIFLLQHLHGIVVLVLQCSNYRQSFSGNSLNGLCINKIHRISSTKFEKEKIFPEPHCHSLSNKWQISEPAPEHSNFVPKETSI